MSKQIMITCYEEIQRYKEKILTTSKGTTAKIAHKLMEMDSIDALKSLKFNRCGMDPLFENDQNFIEQLNQTFTYLVCLDAVKILIDNHKGVKFLVNFGTQNGFDVASLDSNIVCECFASTIPDSNQKLEKDTKRVSEYESANFRYVIFYSEERKDSYVDRIKRKYPNVSIIQLQEM